MYGKFYEVDKSGDVNVRKNETKVKSSVNSKFYKLEDRKYLIIDRTIEAVNSSLVTSNYLMVNLDKSGISVNELELSFNLVILLTSRKMQSRLQ